MCGLLHFVGGVCGRVLALGAVRGGLLARDEGLAVFVHLQLGDDDVGRVDADVDDGAWTEIYRTGSERVQRPIETMSEAQKAHQPQRR